MSTSMELENNVGWREARDLTISLYRMFNDNKTDCDRGLRDALRESATSVMSHISLGQGEFKPEFRAVHLHYARSASIPLFTLLSVSRDLGFILESDYLELEDRVHRICEQINSMLKKCELQIRNWGHVTHFCFK